MDTRIRAQRERIERVREALAQHGAHALLVPSADPHLSEYLPGYWQGRQWLSGFHGSVGTLIVTPDFAGVWADSRYWEQASKELKGSGIELVKLQPGQPGPLDWLAEQTPEGLETSGDLYHIKNLLLSRGYSPEDTEAVMGGNFIAKLRQTLPK